jgi:hypothetical protein
LNKADNEVLSITGEASILVSKGFAPKLKLGFVGSGFSSLEACFLENIAESELLDSTDEVVGGTKGLIVGIFIEVEWFITCVDLSGVMFLELAIKVAEKLGADKGSGCFCCDLILLGSSLSTTCCRKLVFAEVWSCFFLFNFICSFLGVC